MEKLGLNEIRKRFRDFYVSKGHYPGKSASLIPKNDKSLLIINSGMAPLKNYFSGVETPPKKRMTTCQKCIRTDDIENVGVTSRHGTFFEMMGNFSFGDYFKKESLTWGWEFITKVLEIPEEKVWATVYLDDQEAVDIWKSLGMPEERIVHLGKEDNFWEIGLGPCGPCSEIYFDRGPEYGCGKPDCKPGCDCDRYIEFWNHVFTQFSREEDGSYSNLEHPNIDTGMGLERIACIMQDVQSIFDIDTIRHILNGVVALTDKEYESGDAGADKSIRIITDHMRSMVFLIADGVLPSNEGRGYVLRRMIRRAYRHGKLLGIQGSFLAGLVDYVVDVSGEAYPEIREREDYIKKIISVEEARFEETLEQGTEIINSYVSDMEKNGEKVLSGADAFKLYDTFGFPVELTQEILDDHGMSVDMDGFHENMEEQKRLAKEGRKDTTAEAWKESSAPKDLADTVFTGYDTLRDTSEVLAIYQDGTPQETVSAGQDAVIYLDHTPFYAESGGQVSDTGIMSTDSARVTVNRVKKIDGLFTHYVHVEEGTLGKGDTVSADVDRILRNKRARNHSATHLLQQALKEVLGDHVNQAGSRNDENLLRFDFTHFEAMTPEQIRETERRVNEKINAFLPVTMQEMPLEEAKKLGATALFGEMYGDRVRVVNMGDWSIEFCGGTHVANTGEIGSLKILSESGISSGVRRIEAVTGSGVLEHLHTAEDTIEEAAKALKAAPDQLVAKARSAMEELKSVKKELEQLRKAEMTSDLGSLISGAQEINGVKLITGQFDGARIDDLRDISDRIKAETKSAVAVLAAVNEGKVTLLVSVTDDLTAKYHAGKLVKELAKKVGGGGGGKADMAQAGGKDPSGIPAMFELAGTLL